MFNDSEPTPFDSVQPSLYRPKILKGESSVMHLPEVANFSVRFVQVLLPSLPLHLHLSSNPFLFLCLEQNANMYTQCHLELRGKHGAK